MSKKIIVLVLAILLVLPASIFAIDLIGLRVGPAAMLNAPISLEGLDPDYFTTLTLDDLTFGVDARLNLSILEGNVMALVTPATFEGEIVGAYLDAYVNAGLSIELLSLLKVGVFAGPMFSFYVDETGVSGGPENEDDLLSAGLNLRLTADVVLGGISVGATYIVETDVLLGDLIAGTVQPDQVFVNPMGKAGVSVLFSLF